MAMPNGMVSAPRLLGVGALGVAGLVAATDRRYRHNPDPLGGEVPRFPDGDTIVVPVDDGAQIRVQRAGAVGDPVVVLVHGITSNADDWGPVARRLADSGHRVMGINQRGHNHSTIGADGFDPTRLGTDVGQVLAALDLTDVVVVGHSMGGIAALSYAAGHRDDFAHRVRGLGLVATLAATTDPEERLGLALIAGRPDTAVGGDNPVAGWVRQRLARFVFGRHPNWTLMGHAVDTALRCEDDTRIAAARGLLGYDITDDLSAIGATGVPVTVICGTADLITRHGKNVALAHAIDGAHMVSVPGAGHMLLWEAPELLHAEIGALAAR